MDSLTHIQFAEALLEKAGAPAHLAIASLFPQIDRKPSTLHRLYAHTVFRARALTDLGLRVFFGGTVSAEEQAGYAYSRFREEGVRIWGYLNPYVSEKPVRSSERDAGVLAYVSHLYLDTFNQPVQPFAPLSVDCAGQWVLWRRLGDFRLALYTTDAIHRLRSEFFAHPAWRDATRFDANVLTQSMLLRLDDLSAPRVSGNVTSHALAALEQKPSGVREVRTGVDFLMNLEDVLGGLHEKHCANALPAEENASKAVAVA